MTLTNLAEYDGTAEVLVDTNVWVDCIDAASKQRVPLGQGGLLGEAV